MCFLKAHSGSPCWRRLEAAERILYSGESARTWGDEADNEIILPDGLTETAMAHPFLLQPLDDSVHGFVGE